MKYYYVYMLTNYLNKVVYVGVTNDLERRIYEHKNKLVDGFSSRYNLKKLIYYEVFGDIRQAIAREKQLKGLIRKKKDELVNQANPQWRDLSIDWE